MRKNARIQMDESKQAYKNCLHDNPNDTQKCDALEKAFKADLEAYRSLTPHPPIMISFFCGYPLNKSFSLTNNLPTIIIFLLVI